MYHQGLFTVMKFIFFFQFQMMSKLAFSFVPFSRSWHLCSHPVQRLYYRLQPIHWHCHPMPLYSSLDGDDGDGDVVADNATSLHDKSASESRQDDNDDYATNESPDRAISIVSELKANAALFAAFAFGSLNLPNTLTVSESKVTSVTSSISISRPLPESDLVQAFVVLDACTLCLMISCVAASQLLIYRLTDGSYNENRRSHDFSKDGQQRTGRGQRDRRRNSALGRLVTQYRTEFTIARVTFDFGLVALLLAVAVRAVAIYDLEISFPVTVVISFTALSLAVAYINSYLEVFRPLESQQILEVSAGYNAASNDDKNVNILQRVALAAVPFSLAIYLGFGDLSASDSMSRLSSYSSLAGESKLRVVTDKITAKKDSSREKELSKKKENKKMIKKLVPKKAAAEKAAVDKIVAEKAAAEKAAAEKAATEKAAAEKAAIERAAIEKVAAEKAAAEKAAVEKAATEKAVAEKKAAEKAAVE